MVWSPEAGAAVRRLMAEPHPTPWVREQCERLAAASVGGSMWAWYFLRPTGEVVIVDEDEDKPEADSVYTDREHQLAALVWLSRRHPEFAGLLPARPCDTADCRCAQHPQIFGPGKVICPECGGVGWLPEQTYAEPSPTTDPAA